MGDIAMEDVDDPSLKSFIFEGGFAVRRCPERPLRDQFQIRKKEGNQYAKETEHTMGCKEKPRENKTCGEDQNRQDMILLTQPIEQMTTSC